MISLINYLDAIIWVRGLMHVLDEKRVTAKMPKMCDFLSLSLSLCINIYTYIDQFTCLPSPDWIATPLSVTWNSSTVINIIQIFFGSWEAVRGNLWIYQKAGWIRNDKYMIRRVILFVFVLCIGWPCSNFSPHWWPARYLHPTFMLLFYLIRICLFSIGL